MHRNYNSNTLVNDIAILDINGQPTSDMIAPVCLALSNYEREEHQAMERAYVIGWGTTSAGDRRDLFYRHSLVDCGSSQLYMCVCLSVCLCVCACPAFTAYISDTMG